MRSVCGPHRGSQLSNFSLHEGVRLGAPPPMQHKHGNSDCQERSRLKHPPRGLLDIAQSASLCTLVVAIAQYCRQRDNGYQRDAHCACGNDSRYKH